MRALLFAGMAGVMFTGMISADNSTGVAAQRQPVLVELFTSEGCDSCPPADTLLEKLDRTQPVAGAFVIALSEHVDYWNHLGWADPYSSPLFSARQEQYARRLHTNGPYTPQMVVNGKWEFVGSDSRAAESAIRSGMQETKLPIRIGGGDGSATIEVDALPGGNAHKADVYLAYAADSGTSDVLRGENRGRRLHHVAIVKELKQIGTVDGHSGFKTQVKAENGSRLIVFVQDPGNGPVWGSAMRAASR